MLAHRIDGRMKSASTSTRLLSATVRANAASHLREFRREIEVALAGRLAEVKLFGSRARREGRRSSDYDIAVFIHDLADEDRRRANDLLADLAFPHIIAGLHIRPIALPASCIADSSITALAASIARDGIVVD